MRIPLLKYFGSEMMNATLTRSFAGSYDASGEWVPGGTVPITVRVTSPQPVKANEIQLSEAGERLSDFVKIFTESPIIATAGNVEKITIRNKIYIVWQTDERLTGQFYRSILRKIP